MILNAKEREALVAHAFVGVIVEIHVCDLHVARGKGFRVYAEPVILRGDFNLLVEQVLNRMIRSMVPEFQLEGFTA